MSIDRVGIVWSAMSQGEFYSPHDLANSSGQPIDTVSRVLEFLARYGFAERVTRRESIFRRVADAPAPGDVLRILQMLADDGGITETRPVPSASNFRKRL